MQVRHRKTVVYVRAKTLKTSHPGMEFFECIFLQNFYEFPVVTVIFLYERWKYL